MSDPTITLADLEKDGLIHGIAEACVQAMHEAAASATPEQFIHLAGRQIAEGGELTAERVAAHLHTTLKAIMNTSAELRQSEHARCVP